MSSQTSEPPPPPMEYFPSPRPRALLASNNTGIGKISGSNLLQPPMILTEGSSSGGSSRRSSNSGGQQPTQEDMHLNDTLRYNLMFLKNKVPTISYYRNIYIMYVCFTSTSPLY